MAINVTDTEQPEAVLPKLMINKNDTVKEIILVSAGGRQTIVKSVNASALGNDAALPNLDSYVDYEGPLTLENVFPE